MCMQMRFEIGITDKRVHKIASICMTLTSNTVSVMLVGSLFIYAAACNNAGKEKLGKKG